MLSTHTQAFSTIFQRDQKPPPATADVQCFVFSFRINCCIQRVSSLLPFFTPKRIIISSFSSRLIHIYTVFISIRFSGTKFIAWTVIRFLLFYGSWTAVAMDGQTQTPTHVRRKQTENRELARDAQVRPRERRMKEKNKREREREKDESSKLLDPPDGVTRCTSEWVHVSYKFCNIPRIIEFTPQ